MSQVKYHFCIELLELRIFLIRTPKAEVGHRRSDNTSEARPLYETYCVVCDQLYGESTGIEIFCSLEWDELRVPWLSIVEVSSRGILQYEARRGDF